MIAQQVVHQPGTVGVVAKNHAAVKLERVHRLCRARAFGQKSGEAECFTLERQRDVETAAAAGAECIRGRYERVLRREQLPVHQILPSLARKLGVNQRRFAVRDWVADDGVLVWHGRKSLSKQFVPWSKGPGAGDDENVGVAPNIGGEAGVGRSHFHNALGRPV